MYQSPLSETVKANLLELADYLKGYAKLVASNKGYKAETVVPVGFDIEYFYEKEVEIADHECDTTACAVGHFAIMRGFKAHGDGVVIEDGNLVDWRVFSENVIGIAPQGDLERYWDWMFCCTWVDCDNNPLGVVARIEHVLAHGVPDSYDNYFADCPIAAQKLMSVYLERRKELEIECGVI